MNPKLVSLFVLVASSVSWGQQIYYWTNKPEVSIERSRLDGSNPTTVFTQSQMRAVFSQIVPVAPEQIDLQGDFVLDSDAGKLYFLVGYLQDDFNLHAIGRANLDGSNLELPSPTTPNVANAGKSLFSLQFLPPSTVPAVSDVGLALLLATLLAGGGFIISRRTAMKVSAGK